MPIVSGLEREYKGRILVKRLNIHKPETRALQQEYGFTATPEFFLADRKGAILAHWDGDITLAELEPLLDKFLAAPSAN